MKRVTMYGPHVLNPPYDGGSIRTYKFAEVLRRRFDVDIICAGQLVGGENWERKGVPWKSHRSKVYACVRTLMLGSHYLKERLVTPCSSRLLNSASVGDRISIGNFVWSASCLKFAKFDYIESHNSERQWFENIARNSRIPFLRKVCKMSIQYSEKLVRRLKKGTTLIHVSKEDCGYYYRLNNSLKHVVVENGCNQFVSSEYVLNLGGKRKAYFLGSLNVDMNVDALRFFSNVYWPYVKELADFSVFGSNPSESVKQLCRKNGWSLFANLDNAELASKLSDFEICIMPFERTAGSKLKLFDALSRGMYVLGTKCAVGEMVHLDGIVIGADSPSEWLGFFSGAPRLSAEKLGKLRSYVELNTWEANFGRFLDSDSGILGQTWRNEISS